MKDFLYALEMMLNLADKFVSMMYCTFNKKEGKVSGFESTFNVAFFYFYSKVLTSVALMEHLFVF